MERTVPNDPNNPTTPLKEFQLDGNVKTKSDIKFGEKIVSQVQNLINSGYFSDRNRRFALNRASAAGKQDMKIFMDLLDMNGKTNYVNIKWKWIMIVNTIISRLVGRWMTNKTKVSVSAVDPVSIRQKKQEQDIAEYLLENKDVIAELEQESGVSRTSPDQFVPEDKDHLDLWAEEEQRIPEEILTEKGINYVVDENGYNDILLRKFYHDSAEVGFIGVEVYADMNGKICMDYCKPENCFYSYSEFPDFRDASIKGRVISMKLTEIRAQYQKLSEQEIWEISKTAKEWNGQASLITYDTGWQTSIFRPYDDWNVDIVNFDLKTLDIDKNLIKTARDGSLYVDKPKQKIENVYPGNEYVENQICNIYRGAYVKNSMKILEWGLKKNIIRPQDDKKSYEAESSYCFYMYQNVAMRNLAVPEKIEEPVEQMILARLRIQQLVAIMRPYGMQYDIAGLQEMDLGTGNLSPLELQRVTNQTGNVYYRSRDSEGNKLDPPMRELPNAGGVSQMQQLIEVYNFHLEVLRDEIGINEFAEGQSIKPRTTNDNVQTSLDISFNATDYMKDAVTALMTDAAKKIACLLKDSVEYGSEVYRELLDEKTVKGRIFETKIEFLPTKDDIAYLENMVNAAITANPQFVLYIDPFKIKRIARENVLLAEQYFRRAQKRAINGDLQKAEANAKMNGDVQAQSAKSKAEGDAQLKNIEQQGKMGLSTQDFVQQAMLLQMNPETKTPPQVQIMIDLYIQNVEKEKQAADEQEAQARQQQLEQSGQMMQPNEQPEMQPQAV